VPRALALLADGDEATCAPPPRWSIGVAAAGSSAKSPCKGRRTGHPKAAEWGRPSRLRCRAAPCCAEHQGGWWDLSCFCSRFGGFSFLSWGQNKVRR